MKPFRQIAHGSIKCHTLREEVGTYGYALVRDLLPAGEIESLLRKIATVLQAAGWIDSSANPIERRAVLAAACAGEDPAYKEVNHRVFALESFHRFPHHPALQDVMKSVVGAELFIHPRSSARLIFPNFDRGVIHAHQDHTAVAGDSESFTAWIPLHDCPLEMGPLRILGGSHRFGLQATEGETGYIRPGTERGDGWVEGELRAGDVLIFHSLTVHEALPNLSSQLRISLDCRFQNYGRAVNPGVLVFAGSGKRSWESIYAEWQRDDLKYYWKRLPLHFKPTQSELAVLAETSATPEMRTRYATILRMIEIQYPLSPFPENRQ
jgi:ectoine hydroxylase-related dioxygenase (phytanoyl-CoA dioxygenase family)